MKYFTSLFKASFPFRTCVLTTLLSVYFLAGPPLMERVRRHETEKKLEEIKKDPFGFLLNEGLPAARKAWEDANRDPKH